MIFWRYLAANFFRAAGPVLLLLLALFSFLSLAEALEDVGKGTFTTTDAISVMLLTTPARIVDLLPVTTLLGSVLGLGAMANHRELIALRACGLSAWSIAGGLSIIGVTLALSALSIQLLLIPVAERKAQDFRSHTLAQTARGGTEFWSRRDTRVIRVGNVDFGRIPRDIEIHEMTSDGRLARLLLADKADVLDAETWRLHDVEEKVLGDDVVMHRHLDHLDWASFLSSDQLGTLIAPVHALSALDLYHYLRETRDSGVDTREQQVQFWQQVSLPVALLAMVLLGLPLVLGSVRTRSAGARTVIGAAFGIGFYLLEQITGHLALLLDLQPAATALAPALLILAGSMLAIQRRA